jgi:hypothetical protein
VRGSGSPSSARSRRMRSTRTAWWPSARHAPLRSAPSCECEKPGSSAPSTAPLPCRAATAQPLPTSLPQCRTRWEVSHAAQSGRAVWFARRFVPQCSSAPVPLRRSCSRLQTPLDQWIRSIGGRCRSSRPTQPLLAGDRVCVGRARQLGARAGDTRALPPVLREVARIVAARHVDGCEAQALRRNAGTPTSVPPPQCVRMDRSAGADVFARRSSRARERCKPPISVPPERQRAHDTRR